MAYGFIGLGKMHHVTRKKRWVGCWPSKRAAYSVSRKEAEKYQELGLLCKKCYPTGKLPEQVNNG